MMAAAGLGFPIPRTNDPPWDPGTLDECLRIEGVLCDAQSY